MDVLDPEQLTPAARRILDAAAVLFYEQGITAVGVDLVAERSGVTKRTLYDRFGSKQQLVAAYLLERDRRWRALVEQPYRDAPDPVARVLAPFDALETWLDGATRGCAFVNALAELPEAGHPGRQVVLAEKQWLIQLFADSLREGGFAEDGALALQLMCLHEGVLSLRGTAPGVDAIAAARSAAARLLEG
ncbi:Bacterial regulatory protein, tetR family [Nocardioides dokdonensis FR1436]|uniref:Bacterial regulatory protein, tetR family n=1 Tax=Nocardioides dokdonensis FR1436 TaxID=1300347 RepID=A0A1A9GQA1_9ACTN|nr:TetR/AcrR family transcriptional regulator [Nocardioides dokdonensis]ANH40479.1 Bacterial regulatory protein, tetR family [Nocardioides dokdonensis FR1436]